MGEFILKLMDQKEFIPMLWIGGGLLVGALWIIMAKVHGMVVGAAREKTKRELAAYVAEGTLDPDKAVAMINDGKKANDESCCG